LAKPSLLGDFRLKERLLEPRRRRSGDEFFDIPAEKRDKRMRLAFMNSDLRTGRYQVIPNRNLALVNQWNSVMWDKKHEREQEGQVCDLFDASGYAHMACRSFFEEDPAGPAVNEGDSYWAERIERARAEREGWEFEG
jgi:hypothetical protein